MRYLIAGQSCADTEQRLAQTLEASSRLGSAQEELAPWLSRLEQELGCGDGRELSTGDREKVWDTGLWGCHPLSPPPSPTVVLPRWEKGSRGWGDTVRGTRQVMQELPRQPAADVPVSERSPGGADGCSPPCSWSSSWPPSCPAWPRWPSAWTPSGRCSWTRRRCAHSSPTRRWVCSAGAAPHRRPGVPGAPRALLCIPAPGSAGPAPRVSLRSCSRPRSCSSAGWWSGCWRWRSRCCRAAPMPRTSR